MDRVRGVRPPLVGIAKMREIRGEGVPVEENDVVRIDGTNGTVDIVVELDQTGVLRIGGFIERIVASDPLVILVVLC